MLIYKQQLKCVLASLGLLSSTVAISETTVLQETSAALLGSKAVVLSPDAEFTPAKLPAIQFDLALLQQQAKFASAVKAPYQFPSKPVLVLGGSFLSQASYKHLHEAQGAKPGMGLDLLGTTLDAALFVNPWVTAHFSIAYDNAKGGAGKFRHVGEGKVLLNRAAVVVGNLSQSPFYVTAGQFHVPFGKYATNVVGDALTKLLGRTKARALSVGFNPTFHNDHALNVAIFGFNGDTKTTAGSAADLNYGTGVEYGFKQARWSLVGGAGYLANIADSDEMRAEIFKDFQTAPVIKAVPGVNAYLGLTVDQQIKLNAEYVTAIRAFSDNVLTFNSKAAQPAAMHVELAYELPFNYPVSIVGGYGRSWHALSIMAAKYSWFAAVKGTLSDNVTAAFGLKHDIHYSQQDTAQVGVPGGSSVKNGMGGSANTITLQLALSF